MRYRILLRLEPYAGLIFTSLLWAIIGCVLCAPAIIAPYLHTVLELEFSSAYLTTGVLYVSYVGALMAWPRLTAHRHTRWLLSVGLLIMIGGVVLFACGLVAGVYPLCLVTGLAVGVGLAALHVSARAYMPTSALGAWSQLQGIPLVAILSGMVGGILTVVVLGAILLGNINALLTSISHLTGVSRAAELDALAYRAIIPLGLLLALLIGLWMVLQYTHWIPNRAATGAAPVPTSKPGLVSPRVFWLGVAALSCYAGIVSVTVNSMIVIAMQRGFSMQQTRLWAVLPLLGMLLGYMAVRYYAPWWVKSKRVLWISATVGVVLSVALVLLRQPWTVILLPLLGVLNSVMWLGILRPALAAAGGVHARVVRVLHGCMLGAGLMWLPYSLVGQGYGYGHATWVLVGGYLVILAFALSLLPLRRHATANTSTQKAEDKPEELASAANDE